MRTFLIIAAVAALTAGSVDAAQRGNNGKKNRLASATNFAVVMINDLNRDGSPDRGDTFTFDVATSETDQPHVMFTCYQNGNVVLASVSWPDPTTLTSQTWVSGDAECLAELYYWSSPKNVVLATLNFTASE